MSHIEKPLKVPLLVTRGKSATFTVQPLKDEPRKAVPAAPTEAQIAAETDQGVLWQWHQSHPNLQSAIEARKAELDAEGVA